MTERSGKTPPTSDAERRQQRLEDQLRANLQRRKAQARARRDTAPAADDDPEAVAARPLPQGPRSD